MVNEESKHRTALAAPGTPEPVHFYCLPANSFEDALQSENAPAGTAVKVLAAMVGGIAGAVDAQRGV